MAERMSTRRRMDRARTNGRVTRGENSQLKRKERGSRDTRLTALVKKAAFPYTPSIQSWLSVQMGRPFTQITEAEVKEFVK